MSRPAKQCMRVDLPDPDGPMIAVKVPRAKRTSTWSSAMTRVSSDPYTLLSRRPAAASGAIVEEPAAGSAGLTA